MNWINIKSETPPNKIWVLISDINHNIFPARLVRCGEDLNCWQNTQCDLVDFNEVTHWIHFNCVEKPTIKSTIPSTWGC